MHLSRISPLLVACLIVAGISVSESADLPGEVSQWHGFDRHDFEHDLRACTVVVPQSVAAGRPWIWRARFFGHEPQVDLALLKRGYHVAYCDVSDLFGGPEAIAHWNAFYRFLTDEHGFADKPALEGMSRGGLIVFNWAVANPTQVACIYADAPVCDFKSWPGGKGKSPGAPASWRKCLNAYRLTESEAATYEGNPIDSMRRLAQAKIPVLCVVGDADEVVPVSENTAILEERYRSFGGPIDVLHKPGVGHHPHCLSDPKPIVDFVLTHTHSVD